MPSSNSPTAAGQKGLSKGYKPRPQATPTSGHVDAINQMFTKFQLAYHNQFHKAFGNEEQLTMAKQLWLNTLCDLAPERLADGTRRAIQESKFLPTLQAIREFCDPRPEELGLPDPYNAYVEACQAPSPKSEFAWSHPAVYLAGKASDWFFLASSSESKALPVFKRNYEILCERVMQGEQLDLPLPKAIPETINTPLTNAERKERMKAMRKELDI